MRQFWSRIVHFASQPNPSVYCITCKKTYTAAEALAFGGICSCGGTIITSK